LRRQANGTVVVVGASAGGVESLQRLIRGLPADFAAPVLVVMHVLSHGTSVLPVILDRLGTLPATHAADGEEIERGKIYVAPPDHHLLVRDGRVSLTHEPREKGHRPAIDRLFRSAAEAYGEAVVGVVLSGALDDGTAGMRAIREHGGHGIAQDPEEALYGAMPASAIEHGGAEVVLPVDRIAERLVELAGESLVTGA
jgi:two-component system chemotaxis response regulator CheB